MKHFKKNTVKTHLLLALLLAVLPLTSMGMKSEATDKTSKSADNSFVVYSSSNGGNQNSPQVEETPDALEQLRASEGSEHKDISNIIQGFYGGELTETQEIPNPFLGQNEKGEFLGFEGKGEIKNKAQEDLFGKELSSNLSIEGSSHGKLTQDEEGNSYVVTQNLGKMLVDTPVGKDSQAQEDADLLDTEGLQNPNIIRPEDQNGPREEKKITKWKRLGLLITTIGTTYFATKFLNSGKKGTSEAAPLNDRKLTNPYWDLTHTSVDPRNQEYMTTHTLNDFPSYERGIIESLEKDFKKLNLANTTKEGMFSKAWRNTKETAGNLWDKTKSSTGQTLGKIKNITDSLINKPKESGSNLPDATADQNKKDGWGNKIKNLWPFGKNGTESVGNATDFEGVKKAIKIEEEPQA